MAKDTFNLHEWVGNKERRLLKEDYNSYNEGQEEDDDRDEDLIAKLTPVPQVIDEDEVEEVIRYNKKLGKKEDGANYIEATSEEMADAYKGIVRKLTDGMLSAEFLAHGLIDRGEDGGQELLKVVEKMRAAFDEYDNIFSKGSKN
jgi:hypothetical protein